MVNLAWFLVIGILLWIFKDTAETRNYDSGSIFMFHFIALISTSYKRMGVFAQAHDTLYIGEAFMIATAVYMTIIGFHYLFATFYVLFALCYSAITIRTDRFALMRSIKGYLLFLLGLLPLGVLYYVLTHGLEHDFFIQFGVLALNCVYVIVLDKKFATKKHPAVE